MLFVACLLTIAGEIVCSVKAPGKFGIVFKCGEMFVSGGECCCSVCFPAFPNTLCPWCVMFRRTFV